MKTFCKFTGLALMGLLVGGLWAGCASGSGKKEFTFMPGPVIYNGVEYYPVKPGKKYHNKPVDYSTNRPPAGAVTYVTVISTNGIVIRLHEPGNSTNILAIPDLM